MVGMTSNVLWDQPDSPGPRYEACSGTMANGWKYTIATDIVNNWVHDDGTATAFYGVLTSPANCSFDFFYLSDGGEDTYWYRWNGWLVYELEER